MRKVNLWNEAVNDLFGFYNYHSYYWTMAGNFTFMFSLLLALKH